MPREHARRHRPVIERHQKHVRTLVLVEACAPDREALAACIARANDLMALSRERIADELLKLLAGRDPGSTVRLMRQSGIFAPIIPEIDTAGVDRLERLIAREKVAGVAPNPLRRLGALLPADGAVAAAIGQRLRLSKASIRRLEQGALDVDEPASALAYRFGTDVASDLLLRGDRDVAALGLEQLDGWQKPRLPISGGDLITRGLKPGPVVAATLQAIERLWIAEGFPDAERVAAITAEQVDQALRALK